MVLDHVHELVVRLTLLHRREHEPFGFQLTVGRQHLGFVADAWQSEAKTHRTILAGTTMNGSTESQGAADVLCSISV